MKLKFTLLFILGLTLSFISVNAQNTIELGQGSLTISSFTDGTFTDATFGEVKYVNCKWNMSTSPAKLNLNKLGSGTGTPSVTWYPANGIGTVTNTTNKTIAIFINGVDYGEFAKNESVEVYMEQQNGDQDTIEFVATVTKITALTQLIWTDFVDGTTVIEAIEAAGSTTLNTKDVSADVATAALTFSMKDFSNGTPTIIKQLTFARNHVVQWIDVWRYLDAELINTITDEKIPAYAHNQDFRFVFPDGYEITDGDSVAFKLMVWIKEGISSDQVTALQATGVKFTLSMGLSDIILDPAGDLGKFDPDFDLSTGTFSTLTEATTTSLIKRDPVIIAGKEAYLAVGATDANGIVDSSAAASGSTTTLTLSKVSGPGDITSASGLSIDCKVDTAWVEFADIVFTAEGTYEVQVEATGGFAATSNFTINVVDKVSVIEYSDYVPGIPVSSSSVDTNKNREIIYSGGTKRNTKNDVWDTTSIKVDNFFTATEQSFGFSVNTEGFENMVLSQRLSVSGPNAPDSVIIQYRVIDETNPVDWTDLSNEILLDWDAYDAQYLDGIALPAELEEKDSVEIRYLCLSKDNFHGEAGKTGASIIVWDMAINGDIAEEPDETKPVLSNVTAGPVTIGDDISATSNEDGMIYLVPDGTTGDAAAIAAAAVTEATATADVAVTLSTTGIALGDYIVFAVDGSENVSDPSAAITVEEEETGLNHVIVNSLRVYPNPAAEILYIKGEQMSKVDVIDLTGKTVISNTIKDNTVVVSELKAGIYMIKATNDNGEQFMSRFVKN